MKRGMMTMTMVMTICVMVFGCDQLRFAPGEAMKTNAWVHYRTTQLAADEARNENAGAELCGLTDLSEKQSQAFVAYCGTPKELPEIQTPQEALTDANRQLATNALVEARQRPDPWAAADGLLQLGIAAAGLFGGAAGARIARTLQQARDKSRALQEVIAGNELFKRNNADAVEAFKEAQKGQSPETRKLVAEMKLQ